jgi:hypothetical protein
MGVASVKFCFGTHVVLFNQAFDHSDGLGLVVALGGAVQRFTSQWVRSQRHQMIEEIDVTYSGGFVQDMQRCVDSARNMSAPVKIPCAICSLDIATLREQVF